MSIVKPFTFTAGTKARANEVNDNFDVLYSQVNSNITEIENNAEDIDELTLNKANVNGNSTQRFSVADPVSNSDAINKQTMFEYLGNTLDYISGLTISKDSGNPNKAILVTPGAAYDSTHSVVLKLAGNTTKTNTTQAANATYYVYIIGNATGSSIDILISTTNVNPTLPSGYTVYRLIGYYTTNSSSNIYNVFYYGDQTGTAQGGSPLMDRTYMPDWRTIEGFSNNTTYYADTNIILFPEISSNGYQATFYYGTSSSNMSSFRLSDGDTYNTKSTYIPIPRGFYYKVYATGWANLKRVRMFGGY